MATTAELPALPTLPIDDLLPQPQIPENFRAAYTKFLLNLYLREERARQTEHQVSEPLPARNLDPPDHAHLSHEEALKADSEPYNGRVAIIGAGVTGLYLAMMLKYLEIPNVDIIEASNRIGGRVYTHKFPEDEDSECAHNYYDIGAMRIPQIDAMKSTLDLIDHLELKERKKYYTLGNKDGCEPQIHCYKHGAPEPGPDPFSKGEIAEIVKRLGTDFNAEFEELMKSGKDAYSTRAFLMLVEKLSYQDTLQVETNQTATGLFDQAFLESLCDYSDFQAATGKPWWRLEGGMSVVTEEMYKRIMDPDWPEDNSKPPKVYRKTPVVAMTENLKDNVIDVTTTDQNGNTKTTSYNAVFNTTAMGPLQRMDIQGLKLPNEILTGIRALAYDRSCKVAIKFKTPWWNKMYPKPKPGEKKIYGGVSSTDLPISNVVYPSWNDGEDKPAVLMVSYTWAQDATRIGSLIPKYDKNNQPHLDEPLVTLCLQNLAKLWEQEPEAPSFDFLRGQYVTHHAWAWSHDPYTGGAFALFGPGQFSNIYPRFQKIYCHGKFSVCGEAVSTHHAWISGALDSGYQSLMTWLKCNDKWVRANKLKDSWFGGGKDKSPDDFDETLLCWCSDLSQKPLDRKHNGT
ncbi:hypothetical protein ACJ41O_003251 [Fusarium nematophilum]